MSCESIFTPKFVTVDERGMLEPEKVMLVMDDDLVWWGVPTRMASVLELFSWRKLCSIHTFISSRQVVSCDGDDCEDGVVAVALT